MSEVVRGLIVYFNFAYQKAAVSASEKVEKYVGERKANTVM
jgi:hypothetical protein